MGDRRRVQLSSVDRRRTPAVVCAGLVVADHLRPPLDHLPRPGELIAVDDLVLNIGGGAANTAVDLARLGVRAAICARVGDDIFGRFATETLEASRRRLHGSEDRSRLADQPDPDRQCPGPGPPVHPLRRGQPGFVAADLDAVLDRPPRVLHIGYFLILPDLDAHGAGRAVSPGPRRRAR